MKKNLEGLVPYPKKIEKQNYFLLKNIIHLFLKIEYHTKEHYSIKVIFFTKLLILLILCQL